MLGIFFWKLSKVPGIKEREPGMNGKNDKVQSKNRTLLKLRLSPPNPFHSLETIKASPLNMLMVRHNSSLWTQGGITNEKQSVAIVEMRRR